MWSLLTYRTPVAAIAIAIFSSQANAEQCLSQALRALTPSTQVTAETLFNARNEAVVSTKPFKINGINAYEVTGGDNNHALVKAVKTMRNKHGGGVFVKEFPKEIAINAEARRVQGKPTVIINESVEHKQANIPGLVGHEVTHASNDKRAIRGEDLGFIRKLRIQSPKEGGFTVTKAGKTYEQDFMLDEIHAHAVHVGVSLRDAEKAIDLKNFRDARTLLETVEIRRKRMLQFAKDADSGLTFIRSAVDRGEKRLHLTRTRPGHVTIETPVFFYSPQRLTEFDEFKRLNPNKPNPVKRDRESSVIIQLDIPPAADDESLRDKVLELLDKAQLDSRRFLEGREKLESRIQRVKDRLAEEVGN